MSVAETRNFPTGHIKAVVMLALPVILARLGDLLIPTVDFLIVGRANGEELANIGLGWAPWSFLSVLGIGLLSSISVITSQAEGAARRERSGRAFYICLLAGFLYGLVVIFISLWGDVGFRLLGYEASLAEGGARVFRAFAFGTPAYMVHIVCTFFMSSIGRPGTDTVLMVVANIINAILCWFLVAGSSWFPVHGAEGAALATSISRILTAALFVICVLRIRERVAFGLTGFIIEKAMMRQILRIGLPLALSFGLESATFFVLAMFAASLGAVAVAGFQASINMLNLIYMIAIGIGMAAGVHAGAAVGRGNRQELRRTTLTACIVGTVVMSGISVAFFCFPVAISAAYTSDLPTSRIIATGLLIAASYLVFECNHVILKMALRGAGDVWFPFWITVVAFWLIGIPLGWYIAFPLNYGTAGLFISIGVAMAAGFFGNLFRFLRLTRNNITAIV